MRGARLTFLCASVLSIALAGCGGSGDSSSNPGESPAGTGGSGGTTGTGGSGGTATGGSGGTTSTGGSGGTTVNDGGADADQDSATEASDDGGPDADQDSATEASDDAAPDADQDSATEASDDAAPDADQDSATEASDDAAPDADQDSATEASDDGATEAGEDAGADAADEAEACVPSAEVCNGLDDDCDGVADNGNPGSGASCLTGLFGVCADGANQCVAGAISCMPIHSPGEVLEVCNGLDDDCDGDVDEGLTIQTYYKDDDGDKYGTATTVQGCRAPAGYVEATGDCDDTNSNIHPGATETCNGIDDNCNSVVDDGLPKTSYYRDDDGDSFGTTASVQDCALPAGYAVKSGDCNDNNNAIFPGATEVCNDIDDNCNGAVDEGFTKLVYYKDDDGDGFGTTASVQACSLPAGYSLKSGDCNDQNNAIFPGATEVCNGTDDNCNGLTDEFVPKPTFYKDNDGDGWGGTTSTVACTAPVGYVTESGDCNDFNKTIYPHATETCNDVDDDCNGVMDDGVPTVAVYRDVDGDTYGASNAIAVQHCLYNGTNPPLGYALIKGDCDDSKSTVYPGARELCDGVLNNCNFAAIGADYQCPKICAGWPVNVGGNAGVVVTAQLDTDNEWEIVAQIGGTVHAFENNGVQKWAAAPGGANYSYPSLGDLNGDGWLDVVVPGSGVVTVLNGTNGAVLASILSPNSQVYYGASIFDADGDGYADIVPSGGPGLDLLLMGPGGTLKQRVSYSTLAGETGFGLANSLLADLDGDGISEIASGSASWQCGGSLANCKGRFFAFRTDGTTYNDPTWTSATAPWFKVNEFPTSYAGEGRFPSFADVDGDGVREVMHSFSAKNYVWNTDGTEHPASGSLSPTFLAPVQADGTLTANGSLVNQGGAVVDLEGDGKYEVIKAASGGLAVFSDGVMMDGYPIPIGASPPIVADINRDGALDMLWLGANNAVNCWTMAPKTFSSARVLHPGGYSTMGAPGLYPTYQLDPYEPNQPVDATLDPTKSTTPGTSFRAFSPSGMREHWQSGASGYHELRGLIGSQGDVDYYYFANGYTSVSVQSIVPSRLSLDVTLYVFTGSGATTQYACQVALSGTTNGAVGYHPVSAGGNCPAGLAGTSFLLKISGHDSTKDFGAYPYLVNFPWR